MFPHHWYSLIFSVILSASSFRQSNSIFYILVSYLCLCKHGGKDNMQARSDITHSRRPRLLHFRFIGGSDLMSPTLGASLGGGSTGLPAEGLVSCLVGFDFAKLWLTPCAEVVSPSVCCLFCCSSLRLLAPHSLFAGNCTRASRASLCCEDPPQIRCCAGGCSTDGS